MQTNIQNKAMRRPPSLKGLAALIIDGDEFIGVKEQVVEASEEPKPEPLSREQREALARKGIKPGVK